ncbi:MAG: YraN family protein [Candidatus Brennerbacteria bacterium]
MTQKSEIGAKGESAACLFLARKGYRIVERNAWKPWGELDIVAKSPDGTLVCVEVKTITGSWAEYSGVQPEDNMTSGKLERFRRTASLYAGFRHELVDDERGWRLDVVAIIKQNGGYEIRHYENV